MSQTSYTDTDINTYGEELCDFLHSSPTSFHATDYAIKHLKNIGFHQLEESESWQEVRQGGCFVVRRQGAFIAWICPSAPMQAPVSLRIVGSHTDSPAFKIKPSVSSDTSYGITHIDVEPYGGLIVNSWLNRDLGVAGVLYDTQGAEHLVCSDLPVMVIPQLAIHLDRTQNEGLSLSRQQHMHPLWADFIHDTHLLDILADKAHIHTQDIASFELLTYDTQGPSRIGTHGSLIASARQDNLVSVHSSLHALSSLALSYGMNSDNAQDDPCAPMDGTTWPDNHIAMIAAFDHEEVGSHTRSGAAGSFLPDVMERLYDLYDHNVEMVHRSHASSACLSVDVAHAINPNYASRHDPTTYPVMGKGPTLKINANQHYSTDALGEQLWIRAGREAGVPTQSFVSNNDVTCGTTIAPMLSTRLGLTTIDAGAPIWSMHSAREVSCISDHFYMAQLMRAFMSDCEGL